jgi:hypothetical protein
MNWKEWRGIRPWPNFVYRPGICAEGQENHDKPVTEAGVRAEIWTESIQTESWGGHGSHGTWNQGVDCAGEGRQQQY